jgi:hypothetical protein
MDVWKLEGCMRSLMERDKKFIWMNWKFVKEKLKIPIHDQNSLSDYQSMFLVSFRALLVLRAVYLRKLRRAAVELVCDFGSEEQAGLRLVAHSLPVRVRAVRDADVLVRAIIQVTDSWDNVKQFVWIAVL